MSGKVSDNLGRSSGLVKSGATTYDDDKLQSNIALLGFKTAVNGSLAKYNLQDQIIDEYTDTTGIDASASTNEGHTASAYVGASFTEPTRTEDADEDGTDGDYSWYKWTDTGATGSYSVDCNETAEWLVVGGGGSGGGSGGGGGAGGYRTGTTLSLVDSTTYTITVGAGGAAAGGYDVVGNSGSNSSITGSDITDIVSTGGGGGSSSNGYGSVGGSGGGGCGNTYNTGVAATAITQNTDAGETTTVQGYAGGTAQTSGYVPNGGGGGASEVGQSPASTTSDSGDGGDGLANDIIETGTDVYYAGGGGGGEEASNSPGAAGNGGGGVGGNYVGAGSNGGYGVANTGGGGGGGGGSTARDGGAGGSGIVILRVKTDVEVVPGGGDLTLQSIDTTALTEADNADMVMLMENAAGTATLNTDIKGYVSRDSGTTFTQGTLVDEGTWGTNKKILAFHDLDISSQPSGTSMCYKITTHNQSNGSKETYIHATSIGWKA